LKDQLIGTWSLVSSDATAPSGAKQQHYGANPKGILILDAGGRYAQVIARPGRPKFKSATRFSLEATSEELKAAVTGFVASFGTWSVNEADKSFSRRQEGALVPNTEGTEAKYSVSLVEDELKTTSVSPVTGDRNEAVYRRAR